MVPGGNGGEEESSSFPVHEHPIRSTCKRIYLQDISRPNVPLVVDTYIHARVRMYIGSINPRETRG